MCSQPALSRTVFLHAAYLPLADPPGKHVFLHLYDHALTLRVQQLQPAGLCGTILGCSCSVGWSQPGMGCRKGIPTSIAS